MVKYDYVNLYMIVDIRMPRTLSSPEAAGAFVPSPAMIQAFIPTPEEIQALNALHTTPAPGVVPTPGAAPVGPPSECTFMEIFLGNKCACVSVMTFKSYLKTTMSSN